MKAKESYRISETLRREEEEEGRHLMEERVESIQGNLSSNDRAELVELSGKRPESASSGTIQSVETRARGFLRGENEGYERVSTKRSGEREGEKRRRLTKSPSQDLEHSNRREDFARRHDLSLENGVGSEGGDHADWNEKERTGARKKRRVMDQLRENRSLSPLEGTECLPDEMMKLRGRIKMRRESEIGVG